MLGFKPNEGLKWSWDILATYFLTHFLVTLCFPMAVFSSWSLFHSEICHGLPVITFCSRTSPGTHPNVPISFSVLWEANWRSGISNRQLPLLPKLGYGSLFNFDLCVPSHLTKPRLDSGAVTSEQVGKLSVQSAQMESNRKVGFCSKIQYTA